MQTVIVMNTSPYVSPHLKWSELACKDMIRTPVPLDLRYRAGLVAGEFEIFRHECGDVPLTITSGYRTPVYNQSVGGAPRSQHLYMRAIDVACPADMSFETFKAAAQRTAKHPASRIRRLVYYPDKKFIHLDIRPTDVFKEWTV